MINSWDSRARLCSTHGSVTTGSEANYLTFLCFSFLICKIRIITESYYCSHSLKNLHSIPLHKYTKNINSQKGMATHSSVLAWRIPWTVEAVGYSPWGHRVGHD